MRVGPGLRVGIELTGGECGDRIGIGGEPDQLHVGAVLLEVALLLGDIPGDPARPIAQSDFDLGLRAGVSAAGRHRERNAPAHQRETVGRRMSGAPRELLGPLLVAQIGRPCPVADEGLDRAAGHRHDCAPGMAAAMARAWASSDPRRRRSSRKPSGRSIRPSSRPIAASVCEFGGPERERPPPIGAVDLAMKFGVSADLQAGDVLLRRPTAERDRDKPAAAGPRSADRWKKCLRPWSCAGGAGTRQHLNRPLGRERQRRIPFPRRRLGLQPALLRPARQVLRENPCQARSSSCYPAQEG